MEKPDRFQCWDAGSKPVLTGSYGKSIEMSSEIYVTKSHTHTKISKYQKHYDQTHRVNGFRLFTSYMTFLLKMLIRLVIAALQIAQDSVNIHQKLKTGFAALKITQITTQQLNDTSIPNLDLP